MNLNAHILRLGKIKDKLDQGEELNEREIAYVKALWERLAPVLTKWAEGIAEAIGMSVEGLATRLEVDAIHRERMRAAQAARERRA